MSTMNKWNRFLVSSSCKLSSSSPSSSFRFFSSFHCPVGSLSSSTTTTTTTHTTNGGARRSHYSYSSPGHFHGGGWSTEDHKDHRHNWKQRGFTVGIGGPVGSGKTALVLALTKRLAEKVPRKFVGCCKPYAQLQPPVRFFSHVWHHHHRSHYCFLFYFAFFFQLEL